MAASATSLSTFSSLSLHHSSRHFSLPTTSLSLTSSTTTPLYYSPLSLSTSTKLHCNPPETIFFESDDPDYQIPPFTPAEIPDDFASIAVPAVNETLEEIIAGYEELYGPAYSGVSVLGNDVNVMDSKRSMKVDVYGKLKKETIRDGFDERVVQVRRVTKVVKGGKQLHFRAVVVVGDKRGKVGVGVGKAKEVISAVQKGAVDARRNVISIPSPKT